MNPKWMPGVAALMGLALAGPTTASAAGPYDSARSRDYRYDRYDSHAARIASGRGYEDGLNRGQRDGQHRDRFDVTRDGKYRDGDHGYKSSYGPRNEYVRSYRRAFEQGYRDGYDQYYASGRYRNGGSYGSYGRDGGYYRSDPRYDEEGRIYEIPRR